MEKKKTLSFALSQEEVLVTLNYLRAKSLVGMDMSVFAPLKNEQRDMIMATAERAMLARGFLQPGVQEKNTNGRKLVLSDVPRAVVGTCAFPEFSLIMTFVYPDKPAGGYFYHSSQKMNVLHSIPVSGIHHFLVFQNRQVMQNSAQAALNLKQPESMKQFDPFMIPEELISEISGNVDEENQSTFLEKLINIGCKKAEASAFIDSLVHPVVNIMVMRIKNQKENGTTPQTQGFSLLSSNNNLWIMIPEENENNQHFVTVQQVNILQVQKKLQNLLEA